LPRYIEATLTFLLLNRHRSFLSCGLLFLILAFANHVEAAPTPARPATAPATRPIPSKPKTDAADTFFTTGPLPRLYIDIPAAQFKELNNNPRNPVHATIREVINGQPDIVYENVGI